jgi:subtilisin family serine protease
MKKLMFLILFSLFLINYPSVKSIYSPETISQTSGTVTGTIESGKSKLLSTIIDNKTYDLQLAATLSEAGIEFNQQDLIDYSNKTEIPLLVKYKNSVVYGKKVSGLSIEVKSIVEDVSLNTENVNTINQIKSITASAGGDFKKSYKIIPYVSLGLSKVKLKQFTTDLRDKVEKVYVDSKFHIALNESVSIIENVTKKSSIEAKYGHLNGSGIIIAILDTGIDKNHPDLDDLDDNPLTNDPKVIGEKCYCDFSGPCCPDGTTESDNATDDEGHGTHCAGIAAGTGKASGYKFVGVAPQSKLLAVKVLDKDGNGMTSDIIDGITWAVNNGANIISMSIEGYPNPPLEDAVRQAIAQGVIVVVAAGNSGHWYWFKIGSPGIVEDAITVGATDKTDVLTDYSSAGPTSDFLVKPDLLAPGGETNVCPECDPYCCPDEKGIWSTGTAGPYWDCSGSACGEVDNNGKYIRMSGTSMATPHVTGAVALLKQAHPNWNSKQIKSALVDTAKDLGLIVYEQGGGRVDVYDAVNTSILIDPPIINLGKVSSILPSITSNLTIENVGDHEYGIHISADPVKNIDTQDTYDVISGFSRNDFCLAAGNNQSIQFNVNLNTSPTGYYSGFLRIDVSDCSFGSVQKRLNVPLGFSKIKKIIINFSNISQVFSPDEHKWIGAFFVYSDMSQDFEWISKAEKNSTAEYNALKNVFDVGVAFQTWVEDMSKWKKTIMIKGVNLTGIDNVTLNFNESDAKEVETNISDIVTSKGMYPYYIEIGTTSYIEIGTIKIDQLLFAFNFFNDNPDNPNFSKEWHLAVNMNNTNFNFYKLFLYENAIPLGKNFATSDKVLILPINFSYPFSDLHQDIDESRLKTIKFYYFDSVDHVDSYSFGIKPDFGRVMPERFRIGPDFSITKYITLIEAYTHVTDTYYYNSNYPGGAAYSALYIDPTKFNNISMMEKPFTISIDGNLTKILIGNFFDKFINENLDTLREINTNPRTDISLTSGFLRITKPDGTIVNDSGGDWYLHCDSPGKKPDIYPCQVGNYKIEWNATNIMKYQYLSLNATANWDGSKWTIMTETTNSTIIPTTTTTIPPGLEPPKWSNLRHEPENVTESDSVNIFVDWSDDVGLQTVIISENSAEWVNHTCNLATGQCSGELILVKSAFLEVVLVLSSSLIIIFLTRTGITKSSVTRTMLIFAGVILCIIFVLIMPFPEVSRNISRVFMHLGIIPMTAPQTFAHTIPASQLRGGGIFSYKSYAQDNSGYWNETITKTFFAKPLPKPDLTLSPSDIVFSNTSPAVGEPIKINATIQNIGSANASNVTFQFFNFYPEWGNQIGDNQTIDFIDAGENKTVSIFWILSWFGYYNIYVVIDPSNTIPELNEYNNIAFTPVYIGPNAPNVDGYITYPGVIYVNQTYNVNASIYNNGIKNATNVWAALYDILPNNTEIFIENKTVETIPNYTSTEIIYQWIPDVLGDHALKLVMNCTDDWNPNDNIYTVNVPVYKPMNVTFYLTNHSGGFTNITLYLPSIIQEPIFINVSKNLTLPEAKTEIWFLKVRDVEDLTPFDGILMWGSSINETMRSIVEYYPGEIFTDDLIIHSLFAYNISWNHENTTLFFNTINYSFHDPNKTSIYVCSRWDWNDKRCTSGWNDANASHEFNGYSYPDLLFSSISSTSAFALAEPQPSTTTTTTIPIGNEPPRWSNLYRNPTEPIIITTLDSVTINVTWYDNEALNNVIIWENSTGKWQGHAVYS